MTPNTLFALILFLVFLARLPEKYQPHWLQHRNFWQVLIGLVAVVAAIFIVMNPEFFALGLLGDSAFFDLLVLAITLQLQSMLIPIARRAVSGAEQVGLFMRRRMLVPATLVLWLCMDAVSAVHRVVDRFSA